MNSLKLKKKNLFLNHTFEPITLNNDFNERIKNKSEISHVKGNIYISGLLPTLDKEKLNTYGITHIINCSGTNSKLHENINYLNINIVDEPCFNILSSIISAIDFIERCNKESGKVLVHCVEGISRSPALIVGYLMWKYNFERDDALTFIKQKRSNVDINFGFIIQLEKFSKLLRKDKENTCISYDIDGNIHIFDRETESGCKETYSGIYLLLVKRLHENNQLLIKNINKDYKLNSINNHKISKVINFLQEYFEYPKTMTIEEELC
jgi:hypothetical protein